MCYYSIERVEKLSNRGITPVIPPPSNAKIYSKDSTIWHRLYVILIRKVACYKKYSYEIRVRIEAQFSRIKRCVGSSLTKKIASQKREATVIANNYKFVEFIW